MKKIFILLLALTLLLSLVSCAGNNGTESKGSTTSKSTTSESKDSASKDENSKTTEESGTEISFTLQNVTDYTYKSIQISKAGKNAWGENLISAPVQSNKSADIKIKLPESDELMFDLLATKEDGEALTFNYLNLSEATEKGGTITLYISEGGSQNAYFNPPYTEPTLTLDSAPIKTKYKVGEEYDPTGFSATYTDEDGESITLGYEDVKFIVSKTVEITKGRPFTTAGTKVVVVTYEGLEVEFELIVE